MAKVTKKTAFVGLSGLALLAFAALRKPRYLYDGRVSACEGTDDADCTSVKLIRSGGGTGEFRAPFGGTVAFAGSGVLMVASASEPVLFGIEYSGAPTVSAGQKVSAGEVIGRAESAKIKLYRVKQDGSLEVISPSAFVAVNGLTLAAEEGGFWCESRKSLSVPKCEKGVTGQFDNFASPRMPRWSLKTIQLSM